VPNSSPCIFPCLALSVFFIRVHLCASVVPFSVLSIECRQIRAYSPRCGPLAGRKPPARASHETATGERPPCASARRARQPESLRRTFIVAAVVRHAGNVRRMRVRFLASSAIRGCRGSLKAAAIRKSGCFSTRKQPGLPAARARIRFMVGIAWWDAGGLQVEQFFLRDLDEEHSLLLELSERMEAARPRHVQRKKF
jgi:hypothetical protein